MPNNDQAVYRIDTEKKWVALTFDIGWGNKNPQPVLDTLKKMKVAESTFFIAGPWAAKHPRTARQILEYGYEIGSHGSLHENYTEHTNQWIKRQVLEANASIKKATGITPTLIRTPYGNISPRVCLALRSLRLEPILWSIDSKDWMNPGARQIVRNATSKARPGDILLLHASDTAQQTVKALPSIIAILRAKGFRFVTVSRLLKAPRK